MKKPHHHNTPHYITVVHRTTTLYPTLTYQHHYKNIFYHNTPPQHTTTQTHYHNTTVNKTTLPQHTNTTPQSATTTTSLPHLCPPQTRTVQHGPQQFSPRNLPLLRPLSSKLCHFSSLPPPLGVWASNAFTQATTWTEMSNRMQSIGSATCENSFGIKRGNSFTLVGPWNVFCLAMM